MCEKIRMGLEIVLEMESRVKLEKVEIGYRISVC